MSMKINIIRPDDLLNLKVETINLRLENKDLNLKDTQKPFLVIDNPKKPAYLVVFFPTQSIEETAYFENSVVPSAQDPTQNVPVQPGIDPSQNDPEINRAKQEANKTTNEPLDPPGIIGPNRTATAKPANPSRLVFKVPPKTQIPYTIQGLLDWSNFELQVNPIAAIGDNPTQNQIDNAPPIQAPKPTETALELPYQLIISPTGDVTWGHRPKTFTTKGRTELWHTRLQLKTKDGPVELSRKNRASLRAIWSNYPTYDPDKRPTNVFGPDPELGRTAMSTDDRWQIVILSSAFHGYEGNVTYTMPQFEAANPIFKSAQAETAKAKENSQTTSSFTEAYNQNLGVFTGGLQPGYFHLTGQYVPKPFYADQLILSPLGGWLRSRGNWKPPKRAKKTQQEPKPNFGEILNLIDKKNSQTTMTDTLNEASPGDTTTTMTPMMLITPTSSPQLDLSEWVHVATQGRDHYVRIVYEGELWPFRHRAALIKVTERKFKETAGIVGAYLMQRMFIVVREPEKQFTERGSPFQMVRLTTTVTPDIADPNVITNTTRSFWVEVTTTANPREMFQFHAIGKDWSGNLVDFTIPELFVSISDLPDVAPTKTKLVMEAYNAEGKLKPRSAILFGNKVTFAEQDTDPAKKNDNTQLVTESLNFVVDKFGNPAKMLFASVKIPQVQDLLGKDTPTTIAYFQEYVSGGFDAVNGVFAQIVSENLAPGFPLEDPLQGLTLEKFGLNFTSDKAGGIATPNMNLSTLTRKLGPVAGKAADALTDNFDPAQFFEGVTAQLFGAFDLVSLLASGTPAPSSIDKNAPKLETKTEDVAGGKLIQAILDWNPDVYPVDLGVVVFQNKGLNGSKSKLAIHGVAKKTVSLDNMASPPTFDLTGKLTDFTVAILDSVKINFTEFSFESHVGQKTDVNVKLDPATPVQFFGDLQFVEELRKAIPPDLFGSGLSIDISPTGIRAGFAFALPPISVGVFTLKDISLGAAVTLPFLDGRPTFDFNVSEREHPFLLSVSFFGGTGFFRLQLDTLGMKELEAALEFGATAALDIGVASGEVHIMAGIYFSLQRAEDTLEFSAVLTGYLRLGGSLNVLGIIYISVEFNLSFTYDSGRDKAYGRATLTVEVEVLFFSASVELTVERAFGGSGDPHFQEMWTKPEMWSDYALSFA